MRTLGLLLAFTAAAEPSRADVLFALTGPQVPSLQTVDPMTGVVLTSTPMPGHFALSGLCDDGQILYSIEGLNDNISDRLFAIQPNPLTGTVVGDTQLNWSRRSCDLLPATGDLYAISDTPGPTPRLFRVSKTTGLATLVATSAFVPGLDVLSAMAISPDGEAYATDVLGTGLYRLDLSTAALTHIADLELGAGFTDLAFDSDGRLWGVRDGGGLFRIDHASGTATLVAPGVRWSGLAFRWDAPVSAERTSWNHVKRLYR